MPILKKWRIFERDDFTGEGARMRDELGTLVEDLKQTCVKFEDAKARKLERDARLAEKRAAKSVLAGAAS
jgi:acyl-[acyl-carrier-protein] desaturase